MAGKKLIAEESYAPVPLPELVGRVAVLGGTASDKTALLVRLALRQVRQQGSVLCLDGRRHRQTEVQFRLLLRGSNSYVSLPASGEVPAELAQTALSTVSRGLTQASGPSPLLLLDSVRETPEWERTLAFLLNAGAVVVELLPSPTALVFGRYDTVLLLRVDTAAADACSRAVGRKVSAEDLLSLKAGEGVLIHLAQVQRVALPQENVERGA
ncbi:MAG: hypothetical protein HYZ72_08405 [Deltaproteobacteria bacterium]|nr:hypothetical protein [Deltaproteobacteria bacterium]